MTYRYTVTAYNGNETYTCDYKTRMLADVVAVEVSEKYGYHVDVIDNETGEVLVMCEAGVVTYLAW